LMDPTIAPLPGSDEPPQPKASPAVMAHMGQQLAEAWGELKDEVRRLGAPLFVNDAGANISIFDHALGPLDGRSFNERRSYVGFALHTLSQAIGLARARARAAIDAGRPAKESDAVFLVHGHDIALRDSVARFLSRILGREPVILAEQPNIGRTLMEKLDEHKGALYAVVLLTPDDEGRAKPDTGAPALMKDRARQNVILELGFFIGAIGRKNVCVLYRSGVERPSDFEGVGYVGADDSGWMLQLAREMHAAGVPIHHEKLTE